MKEYSILGWAMKVKWLIIEINVSFDTTDSCCPLCTSYIKVCSCFSRSDQPLLESAVKVDGAKLQLLSLTSGLNGLYRCEASNAHGSKHSQLYVHVAGKVRWGQLEFNCAVCSNLSGFVSDFWIWTDVVPFWCYSVFWCYPSTSLYKYILEHLKFE